MLRNKFWVMKSEKFRKIIVDLGKSSVVYWLLKSVPAAFVSLRGELLGAHNCQLRTC